ncbi:hypothetical protein ACSFA7_26595 [Variovorax sp. LT1R20]|uniref:hypothetical protein n=1 Tax=Variovorax sp. LT1R20 TaxID=3443729 RepID=UPI003F45BCEF
MEKKTRTSFRLLAVSSVVAAFVAGCGGGGGGGGVDPATLAAIAAANSANTAPPPSPPPPPSVPPAPPPAIQAKCAMDSTVTASYEEQRLPNKLSSSDALSFSQQLLQASGFDKFGPDFAAKLCNNGMAGASSYDEAVTLLRSEGAKLWQAALDRVQGRVVQGTLPKSDDRMLYWARLMMTLALRQWKPDFPLADDQRAALQNEFERASRGQYAIDFPEGPQYKRILVSGFDPFTLGAAGKDGQLGMLKGNPSGATILSLDGNTVALADGTTAVIHTFILPVNYGPFIAGMQEDTLGPWFKPGSKRVDASVTMSQGRSSFDLEHYNGRYHFANFEGNDNLNPPCEGEGFPATLECDINPPQRWLGYAPSPWRKDAPPQFVVATLPFQKLIDAKTGAGLEGDGWAVARNDDYDVTPCTKAASDTEAAYNLAKANEKAALDAYYAASAADKPAALQKYFEAYGVAQAAARPSPLETNCALNGGGGNYLSNASAYRNTLMRDIFGLTIPAGHIHTPTMQTPSGVTSAGFEANRDKIVAQSRNLIFALAKSLATSPAP